MRTADGPVPAAADAETWRPVPARPHEASDRGRIRTAGGRVLTQRPTNRPEGGPPFYLKTDLSWDGQRETHLSHRLVALAFHGPCCEDMRRQIEETGDIGQCASRHEACHNNGVPDHNQAANLRWDTPEGNGLDKARHPRYHTPEARERRSQGARAVNAQRALQRITDLLDENRRLRGEIRALRGELTASRDGQSPSPAAADARPARSGYALWRRWRRSR